MLKVNKNTLIYVVCPAFYKTGGTELEHQLVSEINKIGGKAYITYYGEEKHRINPAFKSYVSSYKDLKDIEDDKNNVLILPEIRIDLLNNYKQIQKCIWWMSVDNYLKINDFFSEVKYFGILRTIKYLLEGKVKLKKTKLNNNTLHLFQSEYAHQFLEKCGISNCVRLSDYINQEFFYDSNVASDRKKNVILYNPRKGIKFTKKLIKQSPNLNWRPIEGLTTNQVRQVLRENKIYIDFGNHPGKDRFPREAAISGCCVITDRKGSAQYYEDIPIPDKYKFEDKIKNIPEIISRIEYCMDNYENCQNDFAEYRAHIRKERKIFNNDVKLIFLNKNN